MFAKQTLSSASLVALLVAAPAAYAEPEASEYADDEVAAPGTVEPTPVEKEPPPPKPEKPKTGTFQIGAGFSSDEHFIASAAVTQSNLLGTGNFLGLTARISAKRQLFLIRFIDPDILGSQLSFTGDLYNDERTLHGFTRKAAGISGELSHPLGRNVRAFVGYRLEEIEAETDSTILARGAGYAPQLQGGLFSAVRGGLEYTTLDDRLLPSRGTAIGASLEVADRRFGSEIEMSRVRGWANTHQPLGPFTLHLSGSLTAVSSNAPRNERLFIESSREIRGYRPDSLGPVDALGAPVGGDLKLLGSAELELPIVRRIGLSAVGFLDAGAIFAGSTGMVGRSAGFGLLWRSPIGPLRFDWAFPLDGGAPSFGFAIGAPF